MISENILTNSLIIKNLKKNGISLRNEYDLAKSQVAARKEDVTWKSKAILIKDTTKEERIHIVQEGLSQCGGACDFCNGCDNLGGGSVDAFYEPYINGEKELREINEEYRSNSGLVK